LKAVDSGCEKPLVQKNPNATHFNGKEKLRGKLHISITTYTLKQEQKMKEWAHGNVLGGKGYPSKVCGLKHQSTLFKLPY
jgi:hypothetical protein